MLKWISSSVMGTSRRQWLCTCMCFCAGRTVPPRGANCASSVKLSTIPPRKINRTIKKNNTQARSTQDLHLNFSCASPFFSPSSPLSSFSYPPPFFLFSHASTVRYAESSLCCHGLWRLNGTKQAPKCTEPPRRPLNRILPLTSLWPSDNEWDHSFLVKPALMAKTIFAGMRGI